MSKRAIKEDTISFTSAEILNIVNDGKEQAISDLKNHDTLAPAKLIIIAVYKELKRRNDILGLKESPESLADKTKQLIDAIRIEVV